jgi:hypothetical protein
MHAWKHALLQRESEVGRKLVAERRHFNAVLAGGGWATHRHKCGGGMRKGQRCQMHTQTRCRKWTRDARCKKTPKKKTPKKKTPKNWQQVAATYASWPVGFDAVQKQVHPDMAFSSGGRESAMRFVSNVADALVKAVETAPQVGVDAMEQAAESVLVGELQKHGQSEATRAIAKYAKTLEADQTSASPEEVLVWQAAGLQFVWKDVQKIASQTSGVPVDNGAAVGLAAILEYLCAELLELAGNAARDESGDNDELTIESRHVSKAVANDEELRAL